MARLIVVGVIVLALLQLVRPGIPARPNVAEIQAPPEIRHILEKDCYSCHSNERRLAWFDQVVPAYWLVRHDVLTAREHLNFSTLGSKPPAVQKATLYEAVNMIQLGAMPLPQFVSLHPEAKPTPEELATLKAYLAPWAPAQPAVASAKGIQLASAAAITGGEPAPILLDAVAPEWNGLGFDSQFEQWKLISTTERGDNHTLRFILGNDIAFNAAQSGHITPWPDGSVFAKIAWQQEVGADGLVCPGKFIQVELMVKDAQRYKNTEGWGWGRWRGLDLKPYGVNARFVGECTTCHQPVHGNDFVYTLPISSANVPGNEVVNRNAANLPASLPYQPLGWHAITMYVDPASHTTATLFGNGIAWQAVHPRGAGPSVAPNGAAYSPGAVVALVTWAQRDDPHWFGARIPDVPVSVEFVQMAAGQSSSYRSFSGAGLAENHLAVNAAGKRTNFILGLSAARLP